MKPDLTYEDRAYLAESPRGRLEAGGRFTESEDREVLENL